MSNWYDEHGPGRAGDGGAPLDVRELLEDASWTGRDDVLDADEHWTAGRRRRGQKRAGAGVLGVAALAAVAGLLWQTEVFGGTAGEQDPHVATVPSGMTTFVLAAPGADEPPEDEADLELRVPTAEELTGTTWELTDDLWGSDLSAVEVVGADAETVFSFDNRFWGFSADDCGGGSVQGGLQLTADGRFPAGGLGTDDQGCPAPAQTAEDFWLDVLQHGGALHRAGDGWLLLSVDVTQAGLEQPPVVAVDGAARLDFVRDGVDPAGVEHSGAERVPTDEELAGSSWLLVEWLDGGAVLEDLMDDPGRMRLRWTENYPDAMVLAYDGCDLLTVRTEGVDADGVTVPLKGVPAVQEAAESCVGAEQAGPALADSLNEGAQVTLIGDDVLVLRLPLPARDEAAQTEAPEQKDDVPPVEPSPEPSPEPPAGPTAGVDPPVEPTDGPIAAAAPAEPSAEPAPAPAPPEPTGPPPGGEDPETPGEDPAPVPGGPAFRDPAQDWVGEPWPAAGGELFAPTARAGRHDGFDRVVVDLTGTAPPPGPGWRAAYTDDPRRDGSGSPAGVAGDSVLEVVLTGMGYPEPGDPVYDGGDFVLDTHSLGGVVEVIRATPFEGQLQVFIGLSGEPRPYRAFLLQDPMRLVIDVQQGG